MPQKQATLIKLSEAEIRILEQIYFGTHSQLHLKIRAEIILHANNGEMNNFIERTMGIRGETVTKWRNRYAAAHKELPALKKKRQGNFILE